jgi:hypothetical protein
VGNLRDEIAALAGSKDPDIVAVWLDVCLQLIDRYAREIDALGGYVGNDFDRGYDAALGAVLALVDGRPNEPPQDVRRGRSLQPGAVPQRLARAKLDIYGSSDADYVRAVVEAIDDLAAALRARPA